VIKQDVEYTIHDFRIKTKSSQYYTMSSHHFHHEYELYYLNEGSRRYFINDTTYDINAGDLVLIKPYDLHKTIDTGSSHSRVLISFKAEFLPFKHMEDILNTGFKSSNVLSFDPIKQARIESFLNDMINTIHKDDIYTQAKIQSILTMFLSFLTEESEKITSKDMSCSDTNEKIYDVISYLRHNYNKQIKLEDLAEKFYISKFYLTRVFKKTSGFTISEYLQSLRVLEAQKQLKESDLSISEIALAVGFSNPSSFGKVFKHVTGLTPLTYRKFS